MPLIDFDIGGVSMGISIAVNLFGIKYFDLDFENEGLGKMSKGRISLEPDP
ncbi:hypothetical protein [Acidovorax soli]|uniref:hypothetical protein n=1 Tax=Acidovorax soli TaxID=592050 RepID=UPI001C8715B3|nr:hypothetical protein [Acidovorax soli]